MKDAIKMMENNMSEEAVRRAHIKAEQDIMAIRLAELREEQNVKQTIETGIDINAILFDSKFFEIYAIGTSKGLQIRKIKGGNKPVFEDKFGACLSLVYDSTKSYLFAGFADGTIKVYKTSNIC